MFGVYDKKRSKTKKNTDNRFYMMEVQENNGEWVIHRVGKWMGLESIMKDIEAYSKQVGKPVRPKQVGINQN